MVAKKSASKPKLITVDEVDLFSLVIYQNVSYIETLYQQLLETGVPGEEKLSIRDDKSRQLSAEASVSGKFPALLSGAGSGSGEWARDKGTANEATARQTNARWLQVVRKEMRDRQGALKIESRTDIENLKPGVFVEFSATFRPNDLNSIMDIVTPELAYAITEYTKTREQLDQWQNDRPIQALIERARYKAQVAKAATEAVRKDFRNELSREYFGTIRGRNGQAVRGTATVICDLPLFDRADPDKLLDGRYRVFGRVIDVSSKDASILNRNKLLTRLREPALEYLKDLLRTEDKSGSLEKYADLSLNLTVPGPVLKVIPVAIFV